MHRLCLILFFITAFFLPACSTNPATGRTQLSFFSDDEVRAMGEAAKPELVTEYGGEHPSAELRSYIDRVGRGMLPGIEHAHDLEWEFILLDSDVINAFALPGGKVFMSRGLLERFDNEAQVAGVLGHEIGHVTGQHTDERLSQAMVAQGLVAAVGIASESELAAGATALFANGFTLKFGRDQEREADILGVRYMTRAGYDPYGMLEVLRVLDEASGESSPPEFLSTHPHPETRIRTVTALLGGEYAYTQGNPSFGKFETRFQREAAPHLKPPKVAAVSPGTMMSFCGICANRAGSPTHTSQ